MRELQDILTGRGTRLFFFGNVGGAGANTPFAVGDIKKTDKVLWAYELSAGVPTQQLKDLQVSSDGFAQTSVDTTGNNVFIAVARINHRKT